MSKISEEIKKALDRANEAVKVKIKTSKNDTPIVTVKVNTFKGKVGSGK